MQNFVSMIVRLVVLLSREIGFSRDEQAASQSPAAGRIFRGLGLGLLEEGMGRDFFCLGVKYRCLKYIKDVI
jgi:hypothetical protein